MTAASRQFVAFALAALLGCGGSLNKNDGGSTGTPCSSLGACECMAASDRCVARTEACWCPSECNPQIACICGGGQFLACDDRTWVNICSEWLTAVQSQCAGQSFVQYIGGLCTDTATAASCITNCLSNLQTTGSCAEIDCSFCPVCDCAAPAMPSRFAACVQACRAPQPERL
jgi:hypothetical protein